MPIGASVETLVAVDGDQTAGDGGLISGSTDYPAQSDCGGLPSSVSVHVPTFTLVVFRLSLTVKPY